MMGLAQLVCEKGIRVNAVVPKPTWTPLILDHAAREGEKLRQSTPLGPASRPRNLAGAFVLLVFPRGSYSSGAIILVTGGRPF